MVFRFPMRYTAAMKRIHYNVPADAPLEERLMVKREEVENARRVLRENPHSRWYDQSRRHLAVLEQELAAYEAQAQAEGLVVAAPEPSL